MLEKPCPCGYCDVRTDICHSECTRYDGWRKAHEVIKQMSEEERKLHFSMSERTYKLWSSKKSNR